MASAVDSLGGSRNARYPRSTISHSSFTPKAPTGEGLLFCAMARTRNPLSLSPSTVLSIFLLTSLLNSCTLPSISAKAHIESISSTAPFVTIWVLPFLSCTTVVRRRLLKSKGISSTFVYVSERSVSCGFSASSSSVLWIMAKSIRFLYPVWK